jgi:hypothetical protein
VTLLDLPQYAVEWEIFQIDKSEVYALGMVELKSFKFESGGWVTANRLMNDFLILGIVANMCIVWKQSKRAREYTGLPPIACYEVTYLNNKTGYTTIEEVIDLVQANLAGNSADGEVWAIRKLPYHANYEKSDRGEPIEVINSGLSNRAGSREAVSGELRHTTNLATD